MKNSIHKSFEAKRSREKFKEDFKKLISGELFKEYFLKNMNL